MKLKPRPRGSSCCFACASALVVGLLWFTAAGNAEAAKAEKSPAPVAAKPDKSEIFFTNGHILHLSIEIPPEQMVALRVTPHEYVRATVRDEKKTYRNVAVHVKGGAGSFRPVDDRPALTLNFDKFEPLQGFHGLDKISLNNSVQDPTYLTELLCGEFFRAAGVPAARTTWAQVTLNGHKLGLYVLKEGFDKKFLRRHFKDDRGALFDGGFLTDIGDGLGQTSGAEADGQAALQTLARACRTPDLAARWQRLQVLLDVDRFASFMAMEIICWHWDGYAMKRNNYRVYHEPSTGKVTFMAHGMDQMFWDPYGPILPKMNGVVARSFLEIPEGRAFYKGRVASLLTNVFTPENITNQLAAAMLRLRPAVAELGPLAARTHERAVSRLQNAMLLRATNLRTLIHAPDPTPVKFDAAGLASITNWLPQDVEGAAEMKQEKDAEGVATLHIKVLEEVPCRASWRTRLLLERGLYRVEGRVRTQGVETIPVERDQRGLGAGLRISMRARGNHAVGDTPWQKVAFDFVINQPLDEVVLVCELRARRGEAWFDADSLKLTRQPLAAPVMLRPSDIQFEQ